MNVTAVEESRVTLHGDEGARLGVLVSGAAGGIGKAVVQRLLADGCRVAVCDVPGSSLDGVGMSGSGVNGIIDRFEGDLSDRSQATIWVRRAAEQLERIDALVNVAGYWKTRPFLDVTPEELDEMLDANLKTAFYTSQAVVPGMVAQGSGSIVHFASTAGEYGSIAPGSHYAAAKGAVVALTKSMARELSGHGVRVNAVSPGPIDTDALSGGGTLDRQVAAKRTLLGRLGSPHDIAEAVAFLVGSGSSFITGQILGVNGGSRL